MTSTVNTDAPAYLDGGVLTDGEAWVPLATTVVSGGSTAVVTFTSSTGANDWSQYMDLRLISNGRNGDGTNSVMKMNLNNDTGANYCYQMFYSPTSGSTPVAASSTTNSYMDFFWYPPSATAANVVASSITTLFDINSGKYKNGTMQMVNDMVGTGYVVLSTGTWKNQSPITEIDLVDYGGDNIAADSRFDLFGLLPRMGA